MAEPEKETIKTLSEQEQLFADSYLVHPQKSIAARKAGYSSESAKQIGYEVYNRPHVRKYIEDRLAEASITAAETTKLISDIASSNLADYFVKKTVLETPQVRKGLQQLINHLQYEIEIEEEFLKLAQGLTDSERKMSQARIRDKELEITRYDIELTKNPNASRIVDGDGELVERYDLDIDQIIADKERGKIKSFKYTKDGVQVEMYSALDAAREIAKMQGLYEKDNSQIKHSITNVINLGQGTPPDAITTETE